MKLAAGTKLGPYQIQQTIGAGGMGVVYRADDARLGRKVAIKILPHAESEYLKRFEREARAIGSLNHPNLLTLFDIGDHDGTPFLVTELLDGASLRARLNKGRLRIREAIQIAADVARGLAAAHDAGVTHRDVKPDNIFLTTEGRVKILDFGIAKLKRTTDDDAPSSGNIGHDTTLNTPTATTDTGMMIGTPGYMAPEQLDGGTVDARTDIFGLGVVLYEMISGVRAFAADSPIEESYAILRTTPEPPPGATKAVARVVLRCLEKRPDARFQSATDLAFALDELDASTDPVARISVSDLETAQSRRPPPLPVARPRWVTHAWRAGLAALVIAGLAGAFVAGRASGPPAGLAPRWPSVVEGGPAYRRVTYQTQTRWSARLAPDGKSVLYSTSRDGQVQIVRSLLDQPSILPLGIAGRLLDVSAKGELAVVTENIAEGGGTLARVFEGAGAREVAERVTAATWLPDGDGLAIIRDARAIEHPIGTPIVTRTTGELGMLRAAPSGDRFAFVDHPATNDTRGRVVVVDRTGTQLVTSSEHTGIEGLAWSPDGHEVWFSNGPEVIAVDRRGHERVVLRGATRQVLVDVAAGKLLVAPSDVRLKMFTGPRAGPYRDVGWFDSSEVEAVSADGAVIAFVEAAGTGQTPEGYAHFLRRPDQPPSLLAHSFRLTLLPDASAAIAISGPQQLTRIPTGVGAATALALGRIATLDVGDRIAVSWQGRHVAVRGAEAGQPMQLWRIDLEAPVPTPIATTHRAGRHPISPDGSVIAVAREAGGIELAATTPGTPPRMLEGPIGEQPLSFSRDGAALFVMHEAGDTIEVERIELATGVRAGWARIAPEQKPAYYSVVLSADGEVVTYSTNSDASDLYVLEPPSGP